MKTIVVDVANLLIYIEAKMFKWKKIGPGVPTDRQILLAKIDQDGGIHWISKGEYAVTMLGYIQCASRAGWHIDGPFIETDPVKKKYVSVYGYVSPDTQPTHWMEIPTEIE